MRSQHRDGCVQREAGKKLSGWSQPSLTGEAFKFPSQLSWPKSSCREPADSRHGGCHPPSHCRAGGQRCHPAGLGTIPCSPKAHTGWSWGSQCSATTGIELIPVCQACAPPAQAATPLARCPLRLLHSKHPFSKRVPGKND